MTSAPLRCRVAQVTTVHQARDVRIFRKIAVTLAEGGYQVTLIHPGSEEGTDQGVRLLGLDLPPGRARRFLTGGLRAWREIRLISADVVHFHDPELLPFALLWRLTGRQVIYDVHEDLPRDIRIKHWIPRLLRPVTAFVAEAGEWGASLVLDRVIAATEGIGERFPAGKTIVIRNYPEHLEQFRSAATPWEGRRALVIYAGLLTRERGLEVMQEAVRLLPGRLKAQLILAGPLGGGEALPIGPESNSNPLVEYVGQVDRDRVVGLYGQVRLGLHLPMPLDHFKESLPIKLFEYMAAGLPVLVSDFPVWRSLVGRHECGAVVDPTDAGAVAGAIERLLDDPVGSQRMGENGRRAVLEHYTWEREGERLLALYHSLVQEQG